MPWFLAWTLRIAWPLSAKVFSRILPIVVSISALVSRSSSDTFSTDGS